MTSNKSYKLGRNKSLKSKKLIDLLFQKGISIVDYPLRLIYLNVDYQQDEPFLVGFAVPKKKIKKAVDRNRIKRLMRESFRLQQHGLNLSGKTIMMWIYLSKDMPDYQLIFDKTTRIISKLNKQKNHGTS